MRRSALRQRRDRTTATEAITAAPVSDQYGLRPVALEARDERSAPKTHGSIEPFGQEVQRARRPNDIGASHPRILRWCSRSPKALASLRKATLAKAEAEPDDHEFWEAVERYADQIA
jgi:hypothetical protein